MQAQLRQGTEATEEAVTFRADDAEKYRTQGPWGDEDCMLPLTRVLRANIRVVPAQPVKLDLHYQYRDDNAKPSEYTLLCLVSNHHPSIETRRHIKLTKFSCRTRMELAHFFRTSACAIRPGSQDPVRPKADRSEWVLSVKNVFPRPFLLCKVGATKSGGTDGTRTNLKSREFLALL